ncbi:MAG: transposase [Thermodesulfobacteriota bacterium]
MPRQARLDTPGALHHIIVRGINKSIIFEDEQDKELFLKRLGQNVADAGGSVYAWAIMDNHVHILFKSGWKGISSVMRKLLTWYAQYFNRRHFRTGHLFENRFKSILCEEDKYFLALIRYIHLNPVRVKNVTTLKELDLYPWTGHSAIVGYFQHDWMDNKIVLSQFGTREKPARNAYRAFIAEGMTMGVIPELTGGGLIRSKGGWSQVIAARRMGEKEEYDERILGGGDFVDAILKETEEKMRSQLKLRPPGKTLTEIIEEECARFKISIHELRNGSRRRKVSALRALIAKRGLDEAGISLAEIARQVGVTTSSIARAVARTEKENHFHAYARL